VKSLEKRNAHRASLTAARKRVVERAARKQKQSLAEYHRVCGCGYQAMGAAFMMHAQHCPKFVWESHSSGVVKE
jgi:hypothetical protein